MQYTFIVVFLCISVLYNNCGNYQSLQQEEESSLNTLSDEHFVKNSEILLFDIESPKVLSQKQLNDSAHSDFYFFIMPNDYKASFNKEFSGESIKKMEDVSYESPFKTDLKGMSVDYKYNYTLAFDESSLSFDMRTQFSHLDISIDQIITDDVFNKVIGGSQINLPIKGQCKDLLIKSQFPVPTQTTLFVVDREDQYFLEVGDLDIDLESIQWEMSVGSCEGLNDYEELLKSKLLEVLRDRDRILPLLREEINEEAHRMVKNLMKEAFKDLLSPYLLSLKNNGKLHMIPELVDIVKSTGALKIRGTIASYFKNNQESRGYQAFQMTESQDSTVTNSGLIISQNFIELFNKSLHKNDAYFLKRRGSKVKGFQDLLNMGFKLNYVFPDLRRYQSASEFSFDFYCTNNPQLPSRKLSSATSVPKITLTNASSGKLSFGSSFKLNTDMFAKKEGEFIPYMHFRSNAVASGSIAVVEDQLVFTADRPNITLNHQWNQGYINKYKPNQKFDRERFRVEIEKSFTGEKYKKDLPIFEFSEGRSLHPKKLRMSDQGWLQIIYLTKK